MYFFDFTELCTTQFIGSNSTDAFSSLVGTTWSDYATSYRSSKDALLLSVAEWYSLSNTTTITYQYSSATTLSWPASTNGYSLYSDGFTSIDDGYQNVPINLPRTFATNGVFSNNLYVSTNGYFTLGSGINNILTGPTINNPAVMAGNPGDNWLQPGLTNSDGDIQNLWYRVVSDTSGKYCVKLLVYGGTYGSSTSPTSWIANFYRDSQYQWLETRAKSTLRGNAGPYNVTSVAQSSSTTSRVWRGDLNGQNWVYMGTGSVVSPVTCPECETYYTQFTATTQSITDFWVDADTNFANTTQSDFTTYIENVYHQQCLLKQLLKCVDGDTFPTFDV